MIKILKKTKLKSLIKYLSNKGLINIIHNKYGINCVVFRLLIAVY